MVEIWFSLLASLLIAYAVLDGFDLGVGILHRLVARTDEERDASLAAIGPFWDGNEVCLVAAGGTFLLAFPAAAAATLSGFYLALFLLAWGLLGRGLAIELRHQSRDPLWLALCDTGFFACSALLGFLFGVALGNVVRGVPLEADGFFSLTFFTSFRTTGEVGLLDWYTTGCGAFAVLCLATHGAHYLAYKAHGDVAARARTIAAPLRITTACALVGLAAASLWVRPELGPVFLSRPLAWLTLAVALGSALIQPLTPDDRRRFFASCSLVASTLATAAVCSFPILLRSTTGQPSLTAHAAAAPASSLRFGLFWWPLAAVLAIGYFTVVFRHHRGRIHPEEH